MPFNYQSECPSRHKMAVIKTIIRAKVISSSNTRFSKELSNIKEALFNNSFQNHVADKQQNSL